MRQWRDWILAGLAASLLGSSCSDRTVEDEEPPPDIEGLCEVYCTRFMECVWYPELDVTFSTVERCRHNCEADVLWDKCTHENEAVFTCYTQLECPEFAETWTEHPDTPCADEITAISTCL